MNESIAPSFQLSVLGPQSWAMSLVVSPFSVGGSFSRLNGCR